MGGVIGLVFIIALFGAAPALLAGLGRRAGRPPRHGETGDLDHPRRWEHDHIGAAAMQTAPDDLADSLVHRLRVALPILGLIVAGGCCGSGRPSTPIWSGRGPLADRSSFSGRDVLARLCILRR